MECSSQERLTTLSFMQAERHVWDDTWQVTGLQISEYMTGLSFR